MSAVKIYRPVPISPEQWRSILRSLLRECSYLPDPVSRSACHDQVMYRFRRYHEEPRPQVRFNWDRLMEQHKKARHNLSVLRRANEGYSRPLEKVLRYAYGRSGKRRREFLANLLAGQNMAQDTQALQDLLKRPSQFEDGWKPPTIVTDLVESQNNNSVAKQLGSLSTIKDLESLVSKKNIWGKEMPRSRRRNIRQRWYTGVLDTLLPPLPDSELQVLEGLISGDIPWKLPQRRSKQSITPSATAPKGRMVQQILTAGPMKDVTFAAYTRGRPHNITRRFMYRLWRRISCMVPRPHSDPATGKVRFTWDTVKLLPALALSAKEKSVKEVFRGEDSLGNSNGTGKRKGPI